MIKAVIVDDEPHCCAALASLLAEHCPDVQVAGICHSAEAALQLIPKQLPDLLFLDVELPQLNGTRLLQHLEGIPFHLVLTTIYDPHAIQALQCMAIDYLLKPIEGEALQRTVQNALVPRHDSLIHQLDYLLRKVYHLASLLKKIAVPTLEGLQMVPVKDIITCRSDGNYTIMFLRANHKIIVSRTLKDVEELLADYPFVRVHHSCLVNINEINKYVRGEGGYVVMSDGTKVDVSRSKKELLVKILLHKE